MKEDYQYKFFLYSRFDPLMVAKLRPETDIPGTIFYIVHFMLRSKPYLPGLYLTGQDILSCGFTGALFAGVISAQVLI